MNDHAEKAFLDGSLISWVQVAGGFFLFFNSWGLINTFGVFQSYYEDVLLTHYSSSAISWIGTIQGFLLLIGGLVVGPFLDKGHLRIILCLGSFLVVLGLMMTSLATEYYQFFLAQGVTGGLGSALLFLPSVAVVATYFERRRAVAIGIVASGGSIGSVLYPIIFHRLIGPLGFGWTTRVIAFIALGTSAFSAAVMKVRVSGPKQSRPFFDRSAMTEPAFVMAGMGLFLASTGLYIPIFYLPTYFAHYLHASSSLSFYSLSILNAASMLGRIMPGLLADRIGPIYTIIPVTAATVILAFAWIGIRNIGGMIAFACLYGFSSGAILSLPPSIVASMSPDLALVGTRMGMCFAFSSFGILIGNPVASTLLNLKDDVWWRMQLFTGAILTGGLLCFVAVALIQTPPFYIQLDGKELKPGNDEFQRLLQRGIPAAYKTRKYDIVSPRHNVRAYLEQEFSMETLEQIIGHLGFAGYMYPSRPLHTMQSLGRKLVITERMDMHLVLENASKRIYIKPVPEILLIPQFWTDYLSCPQNCPCPMTTPTINMGKLHQQLPRCPQRKLRMTALGLLYSYAALISYESDFHIAKNAHLLPSSVDWTQWQSLVYQLVTDSIYTRIHPRFLYGELLVVQLDLALMFTGRRLIPGFAGRWNQYSSLVQNNIAAIVTVAVFTGLILSAMQVGLASSRLASNGSFQAASYGFAVFCILGPLALFGLAAVAAAYGMVVNKFALNEADKNRVEHLQQPIPQ